MQTAFMKAHRDSHSPYHTNFVRDKISREIKTSFGIDHFYVSKLIQKRITGFCNIDSLISSHNCLILSLNHIWVHPLKKEIPKAAIKHLPEFIFNIDKLNERIKGAIDSFNDSFTNPNEENANYRLNHIIKTIGRLSSFLSFLLSRISLSMNIRKNN